MVQTDEELNDSNSSPDREVRLPIPDPDVRDRVSKGNFDARIQVMPGSAVMCHSLVMTNTRPVSRSRKILELVRVGDFQLRQCGGMKAAWGTIVGASASSGDLPRTALADACLSHNSG